MLCLLAWRQVAGIIVGARNASHVDDHQKVFSFTLDDGGWYCWHYWYFQYCHAHCDGAQPFLPTAAPAARSGCTAACVMRLSPSSGWAQAGVPRVRAHMMRAAPCATASSPPHPLRPAPAAADRAAIDKVLAAGKQPTGDCYTWERGGKW